MTNPPANVDEALEIANRVIQGLHLDEPEQKDALKKVIEWLKKNKTRLEDLSNQKSD